MGRKTVKETAVYKVNFRMTPSDYEKLTALFRRSGQKNLTRFITCVLLNREMKVVTINKAAMDYYMRLTNFYEQYRALGNNYNQTVRAVKKNFGEKRGLALLYRLEKITVELIGITKELFALTGEFERKYLDKREQNQVSDK